MVISPGGLDWWAKWHVWQRIQIHRRYCWWNM